MRKFDYIKDHGIISTTIYGYLNQLEKELSLLVQQEDAAIYGEALSEVMKFRLKYPNLSFVSSKITADLIAPHNVEFCFKNNYYSRDASEFGIEFEQDLQKIIAIEEKLGVLAARAYQTRLTPFEKIVNGEDFMVVGHASWLLPGTIDCSNYRSGSWKKQYLSCTLFTGRELNTFNDLKIVYIVDVNEDNYIASSSFDSVTNESSMYDFLTVKKIVENDCIHYINVGFTHDRNKVVTIISTPELIEQLSIEREMKLSGELFNYKNILTNEVVTDRTKTNVKGALLIGNGCDLVVWDYLSLKEEKVEFKCINKGIYREKNGLSNYTVEELSDFRESLISLEQDVKSGKITPNVLLGYYVEVVLPMQYRDEILEMIKGTFGKYVELPEEPIRQINKK